MFYQLLYNIKHNIRPVETFIKYRGMDWMDHVRIVHRYPTYTIYQDKRYQLLLHHWISTYKRPIYPSYSGTTDVHVNLLIGNGKLIMEPPDSYAYIIKHMDAQYHNYLYVPPDTKWMIMPNSKLLYQLELSVYQ